MDNYAKKLSIQLNIKELEQEKIQSLKDLLNMHPGSQSLTFLIYDNKDQTKLEMSSRKQKIKVSQELLGELEERRIYFKLN